jgi:hypothetical protein
MRKISINTNGKSLPLETDSYFRKYQYIDSYILLCENNIIGEETHEFGINKVSGSLISTDYLICKFNDDFLIEEVKRFSDVREVVLTSSNKTGYKFRVVNSDKQYSSTSPNFIDNDNYIKDNPRLNYLYEKYPFIKFMWICSNVKRNILNHNKTIITAYDTIERKNVLLLLDSDLNILSKTLSHIPDHVLSIGGLYIGVVACNKSFTKWEINQYNENLDIIDSFVIKGTDIILAEFQNNCILIYNDYDKYSQIQKQVLKTTGASIGPCRAVAIFEN